MLILDHLLAPWAMNSALENKRGDAEGASTTPGVQNFRGNFSGDFDIKKWFYMKHRLQDGLTQKHGDFLPPG